MTDSLEFKYEVQEGNFTRAGEASQDVKRKLKRLGVSPDIVRRVAIAIYEGEINMVIHAYGGEITVTVNDSEIKMVLADKGPGIPDVEKAMQAGYSTAPENVRNLGFGAGMGLPNMKRNATEFDIQSEVGVGTTITMSFALS